MQKARKCKSTCSQIVAAVTVNAQELLPLLICGSQSSFLLVSEKNVVDSIVLNFATMMETSSGETIMPIVCEEKRVV